MKNRASRFVLPALLGCALGAFSLSSQAAPGDVTATNPNIWFGSTTVQGSIQAMIKLSTGKVAIGGYFEGYGSGAGTVNRSKFMILDPFTGSSLGTPTFLGSGRAVHCIAEQKDGKILVGGTFTGVGFPGASPCLVRLNADGSVDPTFTPSFFNAGTAVLAIAVLPNGNIAIGGNREMDAGGGPAFAMLNPNGVAIAAAVFSSVPFDFRVTALAVQSTGEVVVGCTGTNVMGSGYDYVLRLDPSGSTIDYTFYNAGVSGPVYALAVMPGDSIMVGGQFSQIDAINHSEVGRLFANGAADHSFTAQLAGTATAVHSIACLADNTFAVAGTFTTSNSVSRTGLTVLTSTGANATFNDPQVGTSGDEVNAVCPGNGTGTLLVGGWFSTVDGVTRRALAEIENTTATVSLTMPTISSVEWERSGAVAEIPSVDLSVSTDGSQTWTPLGSAARITGGWQKTGLSLPAAGYIRARNSGAVFTTQPYEQEEIGFTTLTPGALNSAYNPNANAIAYAAAQQADGKLIVGGLFGTVGGATHTRLVRINTDGTLDSFFTTAVNSSGSEVHAIAIQPDGKILIAGDFTLVNSTTRNRIARLNSDGSLDSGFTASVNAIIYAMALQPDGSILIGGEFTSVNSTTRNRIARLSSSGGLDTGFNPNANSHVRTLALQTDGKIVVGGLFGTMGGSTHTRIARLNSDGTLDTGFTTAVTSGGTELVNATAIQADGKILIGGVFTAVNSTSRANLARLNSDGTLDTSFTTVTNGNVYGLSLQADGDIYAYGHFTSIGGVSRDYFAKLNAAGTVDTGVDANASSYVYGVAVQADGEVALVGQFLSLQSTTRNRIGRLHNELPFQKLYVASNSGPGIGRVEWLRGGSTPEAVAVWFEVSIDGGSTWSSVGAGTRISGGWEISGATLPSTGKLRGSAITRGGKMGSSGGIIEVVTDF